ncbi:hypothetical protein ACFY36_10825 [Actinoplanes sp. NPDC000266]
MRFRRTIAAAATLFTALLAFFVVTPAQAAPGQSYLTTGQSLTGGQYLVKGRFRLNMQTDGNLVLYENFGTSSQRVCAASNTYGYNGAHAWNSPDGYFAVYATNGGVLWTTRPYTDNVNYNGGLVQLIANGDAEFTGAGYWRYVYWRC